MGKFKDLSPRKVGQINVLLSVGTLKQKEIAKKLNVSTQSVSNIKKKMENSQNLNSSRVGKCGRKRKTTPRMDRKIIKEALLNRRLTCKQISFQLAAEGVILARRTVNKRLLEVGLKAYRPRKKPRLTEMMMKTRYAWAKNHVEWTSEQWEKKEANGEVNGEVETKDEGKGKSSKSSSSSSSKSEEDKKEETDKDEKKKKDKKKDKDDKDLKRKKDTKRSKTDDGDTPADDDADRDGREDSVCSNVSSASGKMDPPSGERSESTRSSKRRKLEHDSKTRKEDQKKEKKRISKSQSKDEDTCDSPPKDSKKDKKDKKRSASPSENPKSKLRKSQKT